jgi:hypothetical protein
VTDGRGKAGRRLAKAAWPLLAAVLWAWSPAGALASPGPELKYGVGLHGPLTWGRTDAEHKGYAWPVYGEPRYDMPVALLGKVKAAGFDHIRLSVDPGPFLAADASQRAELEQRLSAAVAAIRQAGLDVIVDFHPIRMVKDYAADRLEADANGLFDAYIGMVRRAARLLAPQADHVAIEVMNEPQLGYNYKQISQWQGMAERLYDAVRSEAPAMTVILTGGRGGSYEGLLNLDPGKFDQNVLYSFHYYLPYVFSMQGVQHTTPNARIWAYTVGLPYPAKPEELARYWAMIGARIEAADLKPGETDEIKANGRKQIEAYFNGQGTRAAIAADFDKVRLWGRTHGIPPERIYLGEFGATQKIPGKDGGSPDDRARWLKDVREEAEARGFRWAMWNLDKVEASGGMTLVSVTDPATLDHDTLKALGKPPATP